jgi:DNA-binding NarL/FixJ family response regulator
MATAQIIAFEPDLLFSSKIESVAARFSLSVKVASSLDDLLRELREAVPQIVFVNLDASQEKLALLEEFARKKTCRIVGYYSHVNTRLAEEAKRIGIDSVVSRGAFATRLEEMLAAIRSSG